MMTAPEYSTLAWGVLFNLDAPGRNEEVMVQMECGTARRILAWIDTQPDSAAQRTRIRAVPFRDMPDAHRTDDLRLMLWQRTGAAQWVGGRNATSHNSLLWQFALLRLSAYLNTGQWHDDSTALHPSDYLSR